MFFGAPPPPRFFFFVFWGGGGIEGSELSVKVCSRKENEFNRRIKEISFKKSLRSLFTLSLSFSSLSVFLFADEKNLSSFFLFFLH